MEETKKEIKVVKSELLWAYFAVGAFVVAMFLRYVWQIDGMTDQFEWERWRVLGAAVVFGFGFGWLYFPRPVPFLPKD